MIKIFSSLAMLEVQQLRLVNHVKKKLNRFFALNFLLKDSNNIIKCKLNLKYCELLKLKHLTISLRHVKFKLVQRFLIRNKVIMYSAIGKFFCAWVSHYLNTAQFYFSFYLKDKRLFFIHYGLFAVAKNQFKMVITKSTAAFIASTSLQNNA